MSQWIDLTMTLDSSTPVYPGDKPLSLTQEKTIASDGYNLKRLNLNMHIGTHLDAPLHVLEKGEAIDELKINRLIGKAVVIRPEINDHVISTASIIKQYRSDAKIILFDLDWSKHLFQPNYFDMPGFETSIMVFLKRNGIQAIGIDGPSPIYAKGDMLAMHIDLLTAGIVIYENLVNLDKLSTHIDFIGLPLKIKGLDGSLTRVVAKNRKYD